MGKKIFDLIIHIVKQSKGPQKHGRQDGNIEMKLPFEIALENILEKCVFKVTKSVGYVLKGQNTYEVFNVENLLNSYYLSSLH